MCRLSVIPVRKQADDRSEMVTQMLHGELCTILDKKFKNWLKIQLQHDQYIGWVDIKQIYPLDLHEFDRYKNNFAIALEISQPALTDGLSKMLTIGSRLPLFDGVSFQSPEKKYLYSGQVIFPGKQEITAELIKKICHKFLFAPYLWGGRSAFGIDCSGFTQVVFSMLGYALPRDSKDQVHLGENVDFAHESKIGDLAYFENKEGSIIHVGVVLGNQLIIHASGRVRIDRLDHEGIYNKASKKYTHKLRVIKRLLNVSEKQNQPEEEVRD